MHRISTDVVQLIVVPLFVTLAGSIFFYLAQTKFEKWQKTHRIVLPSIFLLLVTAAVGFIFIPSLLPNIEFKYYSIDVPIPLLKIHPIQISVSAGHVPIFMALSISSLPMFLWIFYVWEIVLLEAHTDKGEHDAQVKNSLARPAEISILMAVAIAAYKLELFRDELLLASLRIPLAAVICGFFLSHIPESYGPFRFVKNSVCIVLGNAVAWVGLVFVVWL